MDDRFIFDGTVSDDELTSLALSADPHPDIDFSVAPWRAASAAGALLPDWYMPAPAGRHRGTVAKVGVAVIIVSFVLINALGLCVTYGFVSLA